MTEIVTVVGVVATEPKHTVSAEGLDVLQFRLAANHRRFDKATGGWIDAETNWFRIVAFRQLAANAGASFAKGQRIFVTGRLRVRDWNDGDKNGREVEIVADALGHDLTWGTSQFTRVSRGGAAATPSASEADAPEEFPAEAQVAEVLPF
ncbi:single-stranded DNA-binding protein [Protaetiibacter intestinalis]|uniref:Single-stranded DNA-binding protein n=1 Tax=Protaetiibacter intestinalis TaxID=2419774 RepID=A0A387B7M6_9MICO|nr:single-stranded DNA-binding protein [Protaetiibacter intestinalis]AYF97049.1 single-stranded DNA-binding protein [Protaetiibacter intestinalis]